MNAARVLITPELLFGSVIPFPRGTEIRDCRMFEGRGWPLVEFVLEHPDLPLVGEGQSPVEALPRFKRNENGEPEFVDWGLS